MNTEKIKAVRRALIDCDLDRINAFQAKMGLEDYSLQQLADYIIENGADCLGINIEDSFIEMVDKHTLIHRDLIVGVVRDSKCDFLKEDWNEIWSKLFGKTDYHNNVVYAVTEEMYGRHWDREKNFELYDSYRSAVAAFKESKKHAEASMTEEHDSFAIDIDDDTQYLIEHNCYESWFEVCLEKFPIKK